MYFKIQLNTSPSSQWESHWGHFAPFSHQPCCAVVQCAYKYIVGTTATCVFLGAFQNTVKDVLPSIDSGHFVPYFCHKKEAKMAIVRRPTNALHQHV